MNERTKEMVPLSIVLEKLRKQRYDNEFRMEGDKFIAPNGNEYTPENLIVIKTYRFEGDSDPSDSAVLYLIEANDGLIGYVMDIYGAESEHDAAFDDFMRQIQVDGRDDQLIFTLE